MRSDFSSVHSTKLLILKNELFSHTFQSGILNVMFILNPHPFWYTAWHQPMWLNACWASLPWNPCCCGRFIYISTFVNCRGWVGGGWKSRALRFTYELAPVQDGRDRDQPGGSFLLYLETWASGLAWPGTQRDLLFGKLARKDGIRRESDLEGMSYPCHLPLCGHFLLDSGNRIKSVSKACCEDNK